MRSFRFRIAWTNALVSGFLMLALALASLFMLYSLRISSLKDDIRDFSKPGVPRFPHEQAYQEFGENFDQRILEENEPRLALLILAKDGELVFKSSFWPEDIPVVEIPFEQISMELHEVPPPNRPRPIDGIFPNDRDVRPGPPPNRQTLNGPPPPRHVPRVNHEALQLDDISIHGSLTDGYLLAVHQGDLLTVALAVDLTPVFHEVKSVASVFLLIIPLALALIVAASYWLSGKAIKPVRDLTRAAESIDAGSLDERIQIKGKDEEFVHLTRVFNEMLVRLEKSFNQAKRFSSDAAHELKTPLAILQGELDLAIQNCEEGSIQQQNLGDLASEILHLNQIVSKLLYLSQADSGMLQTSCAQLNISDLVREIVTDVQMTKSDIHFHSDLEKDVLVYADSILLGQIVHNLLSNAIKYNREEGSVTIHLRQIESQIALDIENTGESIPVEAESRIFERFYRSEPVHSRNVEGSGLGLSLALEFAKAHKGTISLEANNPDCIRFRLTLPSIADL